MPLALHVPRSHLFDGIAGRRAHATFRVRASFLEIYNEVIVDLLAPGLAASGYAHAAGFSTGGGSSGGAAGGGGSARPISVRESPNGSIHVVGAREEEVMCAADLAALLERGCLARCVLLAVLAL